MSKPDHTKHVVMVGLFTALVTATTLFPHIPTPTLGYIHLGDAMVLLSGILLGPAYGSFAGGIGSMLADLFTGYVSYAPATLIIKALTAAIAGSLFHTLRKTEMKGGRDQNRMALPISCALAELFMVSGYFLYEIILMALTAGTLSVSTLSSGFLAALAGIPFNLVQGGFGILITAVLYPLVNPYLARALTENRRS